MYYIIRDTVSPLVGRRIYPHALRQSFASRLRENGAPLELIQECLGHESVATTLIYARITPRKRHDDVAKYLAGES